MGKGAARGPGKGKAKRKREDDEEDEDEERKRSLVDGDADGDAEAGPADEEDEDDATLDDDDDESMLVSASDAHMALLLDSMSDEQRDRYEVVRRSKLLPSEMKRYLQSIGVTPPGKQLLIMLGSVAKIYTGEIVEEALDVMQGLQEAGPIQPRHLRLAVRALKDKGKVPSVEHTPKKIL
eukprot:m.104742 g.104742  ORF g.104742 m.104742 type:complete len:180 (-) comp12615_c0_seq3:2755-3294(-)